MATLRQKGPPTCFTTLSSAEFDWDELGKDSFQKKGVNFHNWLGK